MSRVSADYLGNPLDRAEALHNQTGKYTKYPDHGVDRETGANSENPLAQELNSDQPNARSPPVGFIMCGRTFLVRRDVDGQVRAKERDTHPEEGKEYELGKTPAEVKANIEALRRGVKGDISIIV